MLTLIKSAAICLVVVMTTITAEAKKSDFPSFNKSDDFRALVETAIISDSKEKEVKLSGKKYLVTVSQDFLQILLQDLKLIPLFDAFEFDTSTTPFSDILALFNFMKDGLSTKNHTYSLKLLIKLLKKNAPKAALTGAKISDIQAFLKTLDDAAAALFKLSPEAFKDNKNLADFENKGLITKTTLSADGLTQTYKFDAGDTANNVSLEFTVKKV